MTTATTRPEQAGEARPALTTPEPDHAPLRRRKRERVLLQVGCVAITLFMAVPIYLIALAAFSSRESLNQFPLALLPTIAARAVFAAVGTFALTMALTRDGWHRLPLLYSGGGRWSPGNRA